MVQNWIGCCVVVDREPIAKLQSDWFTCDIVPWRYQWKEISVPCQNWKEMDFHFAGEQTKWTRYAAHLIIQNTTISCVRWAFTDIGQKPILLGETKKKTRRTKNCLLLWCRHFAKVKVSFSLNEIIFSRFSRFSFRLTCAMGFTEEKKTHLPVVLTPRRTWLLWLVTWYLISVRCAS